MTLQVFTNNETPPSSKLNSMSQQTVVVCTTATRPAGVEGMTIYETDGLHRYWNGSAWRSLPRGILVAGSLAAGGPGTLSATDLTGSICTFNGISGETYVFDLHVEASSNANSSSAAAGMQYDFGAGWTGSGVQASGVSLPTANVSARIVVRHIIQMVSTVPSAKVKGVVTVTGGQGSWAAYTPVSVTHLGST